MSPAVAQPEDAAGFELTAANAAAYLRARNVLKHGAPAEVTELAGGISNTVLMVGPPDDTGNTGDTRNAGDTRDTRDTRDTGDTPNTRDTHNTRVVVKQSLAKLRVADEWEFDRRRLLIEADCLRALGRLLEPGEVPTVLDLDRENLIFTMTAAPIGGVVWKRPLLDGEVDLGAARRAGDLLGRIQRRAAAKPELADAFSDLMPLVQGRIDPYHRATAKVHPELQAVIERDITRLTSQRRTLVLGDYSPKNLIVYPDRVLALDFEAAHWGDPAFDPAFMLTHLLAKAIHLPQHRNEFLQAARDFFTAYTEAAGPARASEADTVTELGVLLLCRVDGKSRLEYLDDHGRECVRNLAIELLTAGVDGVEPALSRVPGVLRTSL